MLTNNDEYTLNTPYTVIEVGPDPVSMPWMQ